ncbi:aldolase [Bradyrhizobium sp.]|uniref:aldolase n=1 Tax=Bradyrhizobium sp. TaxID=376 RepID=UPI0039E2E632
MLAIDQRESMRAMLAEKQSAPVTDQQLVDFKIAGLRALTPHASAVLIDHQFAWKPAIAGKVVAQGCGLISAADHFTASGDEIVGDSRIDENVDPAQVAKDGGVALKLLVIYRPDEPAEPRVAMVDAFVAKCKAAGLISLIEPVSRKPRDGRAYDLNDGILLAAKELGSRGADIYKAEVPLHGAGSEAEVRSQCEKLTSLIASPWVVLSSGVAPDQFPTAVEWACKGGASGFLAGRAVWRGVIGSENVEAALQADAVTRMKRLCDVVDRVAG